MFHNPRRLAAQEPNTDLAITLSSSRDFSAETLARRLQHNEVAWRYRRKRRRASRPKFVNIRKAELERLFADRYGRSLPDDDAGRADLRLMADHLCQLGTHHFVGWARVWATMGKRCRTRPGDQGGRTGQVLEK